MAWITVGEGVTTAIISAAMLYVAKKAPSAFKFFHVIFESGDEIDKLKAELVAVRKKQYITDQRHEASIDTAPDAIAILNPNREVIDVNPAYMYMTGVTIKEDILGYGYMALIPDEDKDRVERMSRSLKSSPRSTEDPLTLQRLDNRQLVNTVCRTQMIKDEEGRIVEIIARFKVLDKKP